jgi:methylmalonyl-CoA/ethylmalonyl-CoA epimerase
LSLSPSKIGQISLNVKNLPRAVHFYKDVIGLKFLFEADNKAFFQCGDVRLMLSIPEKPEEEDTSSILYFDVKDIFASFQKFKELNITILAEPYKTTDLGDRELFLGFFKDTEGNTSALISERIK